MAVSRGIFWIYPRKGSAYMRITESRTGLGARRRGGGLATFLAHLACPTARPARRRDAAHAAASNRARNDVRTARQTEVGSNPGAGDPPGDAAGGWASCAE
jgi:hypothetical protein